MQSVHVVGSGSLKIPFIEFLLKHRSQFGIDEISLYDNAPPPKLDKVHLKKLAAAGVRLAEDARTRDFDRIGLTADLTNDEAYERASVVVSCTKQNLATSNRGEGLAMGFGRRVIAQGSRFSTWKLYAVGVNKLTSSDRFVQIASSNTHNIACLVRAFSDINCQTLGIRTSDFVCVRRANSDDFALKIAADRHADYRWGTHHARDVFNLLQNENLKIFSSALKLSTHHSHAVRFFIRFTDDYVVSYSNILERLKNNPFIGLTEKDSSTALASFESNNGFCGRILNQAIVSIPSLVINEDQKCIAGVAFTPQDGGSLLSTIAATLYHLDPETYADKMGYLNPYIFKEI